MSIPVSKRWRTARKCNDIADKVITTFDAQYKLLKMQGKDIETKKGINKRALGYFDGFIYSAAKSQHVDVKHPYSVRNIYKAFHKAMGRGKRQKISTLLVRI
jgi:hypothetical protein